MIPTPFTSSILGGAPPNDEVDSSAEISAEALAIQGTCADIEREHAAGTIGLANIVEDISTEDGDKVLADNSSRGSMNVSDALTDHFPYGGPHAHTEGDAGQGPNEEYSAHPYRPLLPTADANDKTRSAGADDFEDEPKTSPDGPPLQHAIENGDGDCAPQDDTQSSTGVAAEATDMSAGEIAVLDQSSDSRTGASPGHTSFQILHSDDSGGSGMGTVAESSRASHRPGSPVIESVSTAAFGLEKTLTRL